MLHGAWRSIQDEGIGLRKDNMSGAREAVLEPLESRLLLADVPFTLASGKDVFTYIDANDHVVRITLTGGGSGVVNFPDDAISGTPDLLTVTPGKAKSTLTITVVAADKGNNRPVDTEIVSIVIDGPGLKTLKAGAVNLVGYEEWDENAGEFGEFVRVGGLTMDVRFGATITLGNLSVVDLNLTGRASATTRLTLGDVCNATISAAGTPLSLRAGSLHGTDVTALRFTRVTVAGDVQFSSLAALGMTIRGTSIARLTIGGSLLSSHVDVPGKIKRLTAQSIDQANDGRRLGYVPTITAGAIGVLKVTGRKANLMENLDGGNAGDLHAYIHLGGLNDLFRKGTKTLRKARIAGTLYGNVYIHGNVGSITMQHLRGDLAIEGKGKVKTRDMMVLAGVRNNDIAWEMLDPLQNLVRNGDDAADLAHFTGGQLIITNGAFQRGNSVIVTADETIKTGGYAVFRTVATYTYSLGDLLRFATSAQQNLLPQDILQVANGDPQVERIGGGTTSTYFARFNNSRSVLPVDVYTHADNDYFFQTYAIGSDALGFASLEMTDDEWAQTGWGINTGIGMLNVRFNDLLLPDEMNLKTTYTVSSTAFGAVWIDPEGLDVFADLVNGLVTLSMTVARHEQLSTSNPRMAVKVVYTLSITGDLESRGLDGTVSFNTTSTLWLVPGEGIAKIKGQYNAAIAYSTDIGNAKPVNLRDNGTFLLGTHSGVALQLLR
jgi:hypothetical protein